jgi:hypothetical protein
MIVELRLPSTVEGAWQIIDDEGNPVVASGEGTGNATLVITPHFYRNMSSQVLLEAAVKGSSGRTQRHSLRVAAATGKITSENAVTAPVKITPKFDTQPIGSEDEEDE